MMDAPDEQELLTQAQRGDQKAYGELVVRYQQSLFAVCYRLLHQRQDAEEVTQEAFVRAFHYLAGFDTDRPFGPWVRQIATNLCYDWLKRQPSQSVPLLDEHDWPADSNTTTWRGTEQQQIARDRQKQVQEAIRALPPHYRIVIELRHFQELSYDEIATQLNLPLNTVKSHLLRARKLLVEKLKDKV